MAPRHPTGRILRAISPPSFTYSLSIFVVFHLQTEGLQNPPQPLGLDQAGLVDINELQGADDSFNVF